MYSYVPLNQSSYPLIDGNSRIIARQDGRRGFNTVNPITNTREEIRVKLKGVKER
jgi:hypothetical protein